MERRHFIKKIISQLEIHPICALLGPRQIGKTTLAKSFITKNTPFFDCENPIDLAKLEQPMLSLGRYNDCLIVIDEIQRRPDLFPILRVLADDHEKRIKFLILGSASRDLIRQSSETLAGRIGYLELTGFTLNEIHDDELLWLRGGFPRSCLAKNEEDSFLWRKSYIMTFLERDIPSLGFNIPPEQLRRFWLMLAHTHGCILNSSELGKSLGVSDHTIRRYLDILVGTFMIRLLPSWFENISKRQVKSPKIYFKDSGILHALLGIKTKKDLDNFPKLGSFWEGFALEEIIKKIDAAPEECFFWRTQSGAELDLLVFKDGKRLGYEFKYVDAPKPSRSMYSAIEDLKLDHLYVVYPGNQSFPLAESITAISLEA